MKAKESDNMYCPKCSGNNIVQEENAYNCVGFPFYSTLGKAMALLGQLWHTGRKEKYGNLCICQKCGYRWYAKQTHLRKKYREYTSELLGQCISKNIPGIDGAYLQLKEDQLILHLSETKGCIIPYDELLIVDHRESMGLFYGRLSVRDIVHRKKTFPKTYKAAKKDRFTILYAPEFLEGYRMVYRILKAIADENKKHGLF